ncbi:flavoprotein [Bacillus sp. BGMRC 2118]|nr:flavoprotein [Bacillus sp. BGMRC 2118]
MYDSFETTLEGYLHAWRSSSLLELQKYIAEDYSAREVSQGEIIDFGYEQSIAGWEQGFQFVNENDGQWILEQISILPLKDDERMVIISATIELERKPIETANLFFQTFKKVNHSKWMLVRSYIEAGIQRQKNSGFTIIDLD